MHLIFLVHGIRTLMSWRRQLRRDLQQFPNVEVYTFYYGFFSLFRFYLWFARNRIVKKFTLEYYRQVATRRPEKISVIAHSFGTYVVYRAVSDYGLTFDTMVLSGSLIPEEETFSGWFDRGKERIRLIVNDIAQKDIWVLLGRLVVPGVGASGLLGLNVPSDNLVERIFPGYRHSSFFTREHFRKFWIPHLVGDNPVEYSTEAELPAYFQYLISWSRPIKMAVNTVLVLGLLLGMVRFGMWGWDALAWGYLSPARSLATGYFYNFVRPVAEIISAQDDQTLEIIMPRRLEQVTGYRVRRLRRSHLIARTTGSEPRVFAVYTRKNVPKDAKTTIVDIPTTVGGVEEYMKFRLRETVPDKHAKKWIQIERMQIELFREMLERLIANDPLTRELVSLKPWEFPD